MKRSDFLTAVTRWQASEMMHGGQNIRVIQDDDLLAWARENHMPPWKAQKEVLQQGILPLRYLKNLWALRLEDQRALAEAVVFVCGCGGLGGVVAQLLARAGVGHLVLCDGDVFVPSNLNRQWFALPSTMGRPKAAEAAKGCHQINPLIRVSSFQEPLTPNNAQRLLNGCHAAVDALDNLESRFLLERVVRSLSIPLVHGAVAGWLGQVTTFVPDCSINFSAIYGGRRERAEAEQDLGVLGPAPAVIGSLQAMEVLRLLTGRPPAYSGRLLYFDGETGTCHLVPLS